MSLREMINGFMDAKTEEELNIYINEIEKTDSWDYLMDSVSLHDEDYNRFEAYYV